MTPAAMPAQRARSTIGTSPPCLRSSCPRCSPECSTTSPRRKPVGGRKESEKRASWRSRAGCRRASRKASASETPGVDAPHRTAVDDDRHEDQRLILRRDPRASSGPLGARTPASARAAGWRPWCPARPPAGRRPRGPRRPGDSRPARSRGSRDPGPRRATPPRCRRRSPAAPRAAPGCRAPARRTASAPPRRPRPASSISRRMSASTTTEWMPARCSGAVRARCSATMVGRRSRAAAASSSVVVARAIAARR